MPAEQATHFPNPDRASRLALFPIAGGGVALDWSLEPALIQQARIAFAAHQPVAKLYLRHADADGGCLAEAMLTDLSSNPSGNARFEAPLVGALQAELGFEGQRDGGWLLLARSNRLEAVPESSGLGTGPVSASVEHSAGPSPEIEHDLDDRDASLMPAALAFHDSDADPVLHEPEQDIGPEPGPERRRPTEQLPPVSSMPARLERLAPEHGFPELAQATPGPGAIVGRSLSEEDSGVAALVGLTTRFPDPSLRSLADRPELYGCPIPLATVAGIGRRSTQGPESANSIVTSADALARSHGQMDDDSGGQPGGHLNPGTLSALSSAANPLSDLASETLSEQVLLDQERPNRQDVATSERRAARGSGPLAPYPSSEDAVTKGELRIFGSAAPGSLLDLGGHPFRVGPGGRFSFCIALDDPDLLAALLARLPRLPVDERDP